MPISRILLRSIFEEVWNDVEKYEKYGLDVDV